MEKSDVGDACRGRRRAQSAEPMMLSRQQGEPALSVQHQPGPGRSVLYVHGATFPTALSVGYRIGGKSWADDLHSRGFDVWSFDFAGYGGSGRPRAMAEGESSHGVLPGRGAEAARQIARVVRHIRLASGHRQVDIIAHSWGTIPAGEFAGARPQWVRKLVLFGPIAQRQDGKRDMPSAVRLMSADDQWRSFQSGLPDGRAPLIARDEFDAWAKAYLATDPDSTKRNPQSVAVPGGPSADFAEAWSGHLPYDPSKVEVPTLVVRGEWDGITRDADAQWLVKALIRVPFGVRDVKLPHGTHRMHLEENRQLLFDTVADFVGPALP